MSERSWENSGREGRGRLSVFCWCKSRLRPPPRPHRPWTLPLPRRLEPRRPSPAQQGRGWGLGGAAEPRTGRRLPGPTRGSGGSWGWRMLRCRPSGVPLPVCGGGAFTASFFLSPPPPPRHPSKFSFTKTQTFFFFTFFYFFFFPLARAAPWKDSVVEERETPPLPLPPWLLPRKRNILGVSSPPTSPLPSVPLRSPELKPPSRRPPAPRPRRARRSSFAAPGKPRTGPFVSRGAGGGCGERGRLRLASRRESGGGRAGQRRCRPGTERSLVPEAAPPARGPGGAESKLCFVNWKLPFWGAGCEESVCLSVCLAAPISPWLARGCSPR